jgi:hypothetical protein
MKRILIGVMIAVPCMAIVGFVACEEIAGRMSLVRENREVGPLSVVSMTGEEIEIGSMGRGVDFVYVTALGCVPCAEELPAIRRLIDEFDHRGAVRFHVFVHGWPPERLSQIATRQEYRGLPLVADSGQFESTCAVEGFPTKLLFEHGRLVARQLGAADGYRVWRRVLEEYQK